MNWGVVALVLIVICFHIENTNSREIITRKFDDMCEIKFYGVQNFIVEHDKFDKTTAKRRRKTDRSLETLGKRRFCFKIIPCGPSMMDCLFTRNLPETGRKPAKNQKKTFLAGFRQVSGRFPEIHH